MSSLRVNFLVHRACLLLLTLPLLLIHFEIARAQGGVGSTRGLPDSAAGIHTLQGHVYLPSGRHAGSGVLVKLDGNVNGSRRASTDGDGSFLFNSLPAAEYTITVDGGPDYELAKESVTIFGTSAAGTMHSGQTLVRDIQLFPKGVSRDVLESYKKGVQFAQSNDTNKAIEQFKRAVSIQSDFAPALNQLGVQYLKLGQADKAAEVLAAAVKLAPNEFEPRLNYGIALLGLKKYPEAEEQLTTALKQNSSSPTAHMYLGMALVNQKKMDDAQKEFETAVSSNSAEVGQAHRYLGGIYWGNHDYKRAADELETYLKLTPKAPDAERTRTAIKELRAKQPPAN
jgi:Tfp pilus assembly protein PilF